MKDIPIVDFDSPAFDPEKVQVRRLNGRESISQLFEFDIHIVCSDPGGIDVSALLASRSSIVVKRQSSKDGQVHEQRRIFGIVRKVIDRLVVGARHTEYTLKFVPRVWMATQTTITDIFQEMTIQQIVEKKLQDNSNLAPGNDVEFRLMGTYNPKEFVVQYQETDMDFISRLCEDAGIFYFFEHREGKDVIVFADDNSHFPATEPASVPVMMRGDETNVYDLDVEHALVTTSFAQRDYNYRNPGMDVLGEASLTWQGGGLRDEFGAHLKDPGEAQQIALVRSQEEGCRAMIYVGTGEEPGICSGAVVKLEGHPRGDLELVIIEVEHWAVQPAFGMGETGEESYTQKFRAILKDTPFRPPRITPKPVVPGVVTGLVEAEASTEQGAIDDQGRYKVAFMYDAVTGRDTGKASRPLRMAQPSAGADRSFHLPLKEGTEVIITCVNGDPDRPIIAGAVPNPRTMSPVTSANAEKSGMKTNKNEWFFDDAKPRFKLCVDGETNVFQVGAPNAPEQGFVLGTAANISSAAGGAMTNISSAALGFYEWKAATARTNISAVAGKKNPFSAWQKAKVVMKITDNFLKAATSGLDQTLKLLEGSLNENKKNAEKAQKAAEDAQKQTRQQAMDELADTWAANNPVQPPALPPTNPYEYPNPPPQKTTTNPDGSVTTRVETEDEYNQRMLGDYTQNGLQGETQSTQESVEQQEQIQESLNNAAANVQTAQNNVAAAASEIKSFQQGNAAVANDVGTYAKMLSTAIGAVNTIDAFISKRSELLGKLNQTVEQAEAAALLALSSSEAKGTSQRFTIKKYPFKKYFNYQAASESVGLCGGKVALVSADHSSLLGKKSVNIVAGNITHLKSKKLMELAVKQQMVLSTEGKINAWAGDRITIVAHSESNPRAELREIKEPFNVLLFAEKGIKLESENKDIDGKAKQNIKLEATEKNIELNAPAKQLCAFGKTRAYIGAGGFGMVSDEKQATLGLLKQPSSLTGAAVDLKNGLMFKKKKFEAAIQDSRFCLTPSRSNIKSGGSTINVKKDGDIVATAKGQWKLIGQKVMIG